ncbi:Predicted nucleotidyltransferase [Algoriphagus alkaliphilus]|jgi:predicted nucleotidyltransferase|uniref:Predicted nucleotidyltransferase n=1 Tax=Algoriphagus alkaliphilus TaxID=279824 RepID=A0A1G5YJQ8_9BACT|nr:nucleotidyltransferase domain-containing protein [Algoriphagus alkaliphilus]SDA83048.1 Predicted nucleotidyltransferase [Algoriphagus alkaliphilus]
MYQVEASVAQYKTITTNNYLCPMNLENKDIDNQVNEPELASYALINGLGLINKALPDLRKICSRYHVERLDLFGSALKGPFSKKSDIDFLVKFTPVPLEDYFENFINFKISLEKLLGRKVDLIEKQTLKNSYLIESIENDHLKVYGK